MVNVGILVHQYVSNPSDPEISRFLSWLNIPASLVLVLSSLVHGIYQSGSSTRDEKNITNEIHSILRIQTLSFLKFSTEN